MGSDGKKGCRETRRVKNVMGSGDQLVRLNCMKLPYV